MAESFEIQEVRERLRTDTPFWASNCAVILDAQRQPIKLVPRPWQLEFDRALEKQRAAGMPMRAIILKARKLGFSTWVQAKFMQRLTQQSYQYALAVAHLRSASGQLADMVRLMYENLPTEEELGLGFNIRPQIVGEGQTRQGTRWMSLGDKRRPTQASVYETMTAGSKGGGRASTPTMLHCSEAAHYDDPGFILGLLNAVAKEPESIVVIESTAKGFNDFHDRWVRAVEGAEDPETGGLYVPLFYGWQDNPFNAMRFVSDQARDRFEGTIGDPDGGGDDEEPWLIEQFGVTLEQLYWRRITVSEECGGSIEEFHQEHPATPEQAFIGSGNPVFPGILIARAIKQAEEAPEPVTGVLRGLDWTERTTKAGTVLVPGSAVWTPQQMMTPEDLGVWGATGVMRVWEHPRIGVEAAQEAYSRGAIDLAVLEQEVAAQENGQVGPGQYVVFVDPAQGRGTVGEKDYAVIQVVDHESLMQVASYMSRIPIHDLPLVAFLVGTYYNQAWLAPEVTGLGIGVLDALAKDYRYRRLYRRRRAGDDRRNDNREQLLGWMTDRRTKPLMETTFGQALKDGTHGVRCVRTARQFTTYVENDRGEHGAQQGSHDDLVMAYMGVQRVASELRPSGAKKRTGRVSGFTVDDELTGF